MGGKTKKDIGYEFSNNTLRIAEKALKRDNRRYIAVDFRYRRQGTDVDITHVDVSLALQAVHIHFGDKDEVIEELEDARSGGQR